MNKFLLILFSCLLPVFSFAENTWLWYPGQLAAYKQAEQKALSKARCVNVDYPGRFLGPSQTCYFKASMTLAQAKKLKYNSTGTTTVRQDNHNVIIKVETKVGILPSLSVVTPSKWSVSLDGKKWNVAETPSSRWAETYVSKLANGEKNTFSETVIPVIPTSIIALRHCARAALVPVRNGNDGNNRNGNDSDNQNVNNPISFGKNGAALIDFNTLELGYVTLTAQGKGKLHFTAGESQEEAMNEEQKYNEQIELPTITLDGSEQEIQLPVYALRYLKIRATDSCKVSNVVFNTLMWPVKEQLTFECSDPHINALFNTGVATLKTSLHNFYLDGVKRDFLPWAMDAMVSSLGADYCFGDQQVTRNCISIALMKPNPTAEDFGVVDYPLHALIGLEEEYQRYGDLQTSLMFRDRIEQQLALYEKQLDSRGFLNAAKPTWGFIPGWNLQNGPVKYGAATYAQMLLYINFQIAEKFEKRWGNSKAAKHYADLAKTLGDKIVKTFWDENRHAFINGFDERGNKDTRISHQAQIAAVIAGLYPGQYYDDLFDNILPNLPHYYTDVSYEKGYDALAYVKAGKVKELFTLLDKVWGRWLNEGYIRYPENFSIDASLAEQLSFYGRPYGLSLCHGANGVPPVLACMKGILGFSQTGKDEYTIYPNLMNLKWAKGRIPTSQGYITISLNSNGKSTVTAPKGCKVKVAKGILTL